MCLILSEFPSVFNMFKYICVTNLFRKSLWKEFINSLPNICQMVAKKSCKTIWYGEWWPHSIPISPLKNIIGMGCQLKSFQCSRNLASDSCVVITQESGAKLREHWNDYFQRQFSMSNESFCGVEWVSIKNISILDM